MSHLGYGLLKVMPLGDTNRLFIPSRGPPTAGLLKGPGPTKALFYFPTKQSNWQMKLHEASTYTRASYSAPVPCGAILLRGHVFSGSAPWQKLLDLSHLGRRHAEYFRACSVV